MQIDLMCSVVEAYIYRMKGVQVRIDRRAVAGDGRQVAMLMNAYQIAVNGNKEHSNI
jgi:hypothetical protein